MNKKPKVLVLRTAGTNCDAETGFAFKTAGAQVDLVHINRLLNKEISLQDYHILALPGGFSYGDDIESGKIFANELRLKLAEDIGRFISDGKLIIGICNGFQVLAKAGILPGPLTAQEENDRDRAVKTTLMTNDSGKFEDRWVHLRVVGESPWLEGCKKTIYLPVAHAEGKFVTQDKKVLERLCSNGQVAFRYCTADGTRPRYPQNPNGSIDDIAGITDKTGRILGIMPHPERHFLFTQHPFWTRLPKNSKFGDGAKIFENGMTYMKKYL